MSRIIAVTNQKGGIGKSTTAQALGAGLSLKGFKVLFADLDPQGNLSYSTQADPTKPTAYDLLTKRAGAAETIQPIERAHIIPAAAALSGADMEINGTGKEYRLREALEPIKKKYDFIILDTPPALGTLTVNALTAADAVIIPAQADIYSLQGIGQLAETIQAVKTYCNRSLNIGGILLTRHSSRTILARDMVELIEQTAAQIGTKVYKTIIREGIAVKEAQANRQSLFDYAPNSKPAIDYAAFIDEFLEGSGKA